MLITYPIAWACAEGSNIITVTSEMIWYGILDVLAGPVFLFLFLFERRREAGRRLRRSGSGQV